MQSIFRISNITLGLKHTTLTNQLNKKGKKKFLKEKEKLGGPKNRHITDYISHMCIAKRHNTTFTPASLQTSHEGISLLQNHLRRSRKDLIPSKMLPSTLLSHWSNTSSLRAFSF